MNRFPASAGDFPVLTVCGVAVVLTPGASGKAADDSLSSNVEVKNEWSSFSTFSYVSSVHSPL
jgi:hypothetical protein